VRVRWSRVLLQVKADEFCQTSEFCDATVATTLLRLPGDWLAAGLLIHPCLKLPGRLSLSLVPLSSSSLSLSPSLSMVAPALCSLL
jgi:hypothetical protein